MTFEFPDGPDSDLDAWAELAQRVVDEFDLDFYPEVALRDALALFTEAHGREPDADRESDWDALYDLVLSLEGFYQ